MGANKEKQAKTSERAAVRQMEARCACPMLSPVPVPRTTRTSAKGAGTRAGVRQRAQKRTAAATVRPADCENTAAAQCGVSRLLAHREQGVGKLRTDLAHEKAVTERAALLSWVPMGAQSGGVRNFPPPRFMACARPPLCLPLGCAPVAAALMATSSPPPPTPPPQHKGKKAKRSLCTTSTNNNKILH